MDILLQKSMNVFKGNKRCIPVNIAKFLRTPILKIIYKRLPLPTTSHMKTPFWNLIDALLLGISLTEHI